MALLLLSGCATLQYYGQAIDGEMTILHEARPIPQVLADPHTPAPLRTQLSQIEVIREFAATRLHLPADHDFETYTALGRPYAVWNVFAAPPFSIHLHRWCFPIAGCVPYRGYFARAAAEQEASELAARGADVYVGGAPSYSTLGWFHDPVLSSALSASSAHNAGLIFHELAHALIYVPGDPEFNESFAMTVQDVGVRRWLKAEGRPGEARRYHARMEREWAVGSVVAEGLGALDRLYHRGKSPAEMSAAKQRLMQQIRYKLEAASGGWAPPVLNNASLGALETYSGGVRAFRRLLACNGGHLLAFYAAVRRLGQETPGQRAAWMATAPACPSLIPPGTGAAPDGDASRAPAIPALAGPGRSPAARSAVHP